MALLKSYVAPSIISPSLNLKCVCKSFFHCIKSLAEYLLVSRSANAKIKMREEEHKEM